MTLMGFFLSKGFLKFAFFCVLFVAIFVFIFIAWLSRDLPDPNKLQDRQVAQSTKIYDRTGETSLYEIHGDEQRTLVPLDEIPEYVKNATIAIEDKDFYEHGGFSLWAIFRAIVTRRGGGSTLTQQFTKNTVLYNEPNRYIRKFKEWILTPKIEKKYSKDEILQMYLNEMPYGSTAYGVEAASQRYFGKEVKDVNLAESAILAAIIQAPSRYSPYGPNKDILIGRQHYVLDLMVEQGFTTEPKAEAAKMYDLDFKKPSTNITAPHFVMYVKEKLAERYGEKMIEQEGLKIYTTLDLYKQEIAEEVIDEAVEGNEENYDATNAALVSIDPKTGQVLAMVGSRDYFDEEIDGQFNVTTALRQPGSSLKPLAYATAFTKGYTPNTVIYDVVTDFDAGEGEDNVYEPHNYDDEEHGPVTIRKALAGSLNVPAVKALYLAGVKNVSKLAGDFGYTSLSDHDHFGLSLVLGGAEVKLLEHVNAYGVFAREGIYHPISVILKVEDKDGNILEEFEEREEKVMDSKIARMINDVLSDNEARAYAFGIDNWLNLGERPIAAKTGTTNDYRDAWTIGYTPSIVTGVWVGNNDNTEMKRGAAGGVVAAPIWKHFMKKVLGDTPIEEFRELNEEEMKTGKPILDGDIDAGNKIRIDKSSGLLATEHTPESNIIEKSFKQAHSILYYVYKDKPLEDAPKKPEKDSQFELWESRILEWAEEKGFASSTPPTEYDNLHLPENKPKFEILAPTNNQAITEIFFVSRVKATAPRGVHKVEYYINDSLVSTASSFPFSMEKQINFLRNGYHNLKVRVCDDIDNCREKEVEFNLILNSDIELSGNIGASWNSPGNGLAVNSIDFPLELKFNIDNPAETAKVKVFASSDEGDAQLIAELQPVEGNIVSGRWNRVPPSGTYKLYGEVIGWGGQSKDVGEIAITVNSETN